MREILFRGKTLDGRWIYGGYFKLPFDGITYYHKIHALPENYSHVIKEETLGQYIGLKDKNGVKIFEGDIVRAKDSFFYNDGYYKIVYTKGGFIAEDKNESEEVTFGKDVSLDDFEVVGNIHDNPELLKGDIK